MNMPCTGAEHAADGMFLLDLVAGQQRWYQGSLDDFPGAAGSQGMISSGRSSHKATPM